MTYTNLLESVEESARERERELREKAERSIRDITQEAQEQADLLAKKHMERAVRMAAAERNKALYLVKAENKRESIQAREDLLSRSFEKAGQDLIKIRSDPDYQRIFSALLEEAVANLKGNEVRIRVDRQDLSLCKKAAEGLPVKAEIVADMTSAGGVIVTNPSGDVVIANTIESRLERAKELLRLEISAILDGG